MIRGVQTIGAAVAFVVTSAISAAAGQFVPGRELQLSFNADGTVNLKAHNVSAREILVEWRRQCQCHVVNAEQLPGGAIMLPLQFENATQSDVLRSLLRSAAGFVLTPQRPGVQSASNYETIYILATSSPVAGAYVPPPVPAGPIVPTPGGPDDELPPVVPVPGPTQPPPAAQPASSQNPFGSRSTSSPFVTITPSQGPVTTPGTPVPAATAPGMPAPAPGAAPGQPPPPPPPPPPARSGTVVAPIVPVQSNP